LLQDIRTAAANCLARWPLKSYMYVKSPYLLGHSNGANFRINNCITNNGGNAYTFNSGKEKPS